MCCRTFDGAMSSMFFFQAEDGIRDLVRSRGLGDVYKRQGKAYPEVTPAFMPSSLFISCLDRLGILYLPTCVRSRYGLHI